MPRPSDISAPSGLWPDLTPGDAPAGALARTRRSWQRNRDEAQCLLRLRQLTAEVLAPLFQDTPPTTSMVFSKAGLDDLVAKLRATDPVNARRWQNILRAALSTAAKKGWYDGPLPSPIIQARLKGSPVTPENFPLAARVDRLRSTFIGHVAAGNIDIKALPGLVLVSAMINGGLLDLGLVEQLATRPIRPGNLLLWNWIQFDVPNSVEGSKGRRGAASRRWIIDPLTASLIVRWLSSDRHGALLPKGNALDGRQLTVALWRLVRPTIEAIDPELARDLGSIHAFVKGVTLALALHLPPFLLEFATGRLRSLSLPDHGWLRLVSGRMLGPVAAVAVTETLPPLDPASELPVENPADRMKQHELLRRVRSMLRRAKRKPCVRDDLRRFIDAETATATPITAALLDWSHFRLTRAGGLAKAGTVERYLVAIGDRLIDFVGTRPLASLSQEDWVDIYESLRDSGETGDEANRRAGVSMLFHQWLAAKGVAPADVAVDGVDGAGGGVDANVMTPAEYQRALDLVDRLMAEGDPHARAAKQAIRLGIGGGLRIAEMLALRVRDLRRLQDKADCVVRRGKTINARRVLPADVMPFGEGIAEVMMDFAEAAPNDWVLSEPGYPQQPVDQQAVIDLVVWILRTVTGDTTLHIHHLRHTHLTFLHLLLTAPTKVWSRFPPAHSSQWDVEELGAHHRHVHETLFGGPWPTRRAAYALADRAGHATPGITFNSYIHCHDVALYFALCDDLERRTSPEVLSKLIEIPEHQLPDFRQSLKVDSNVELIAQRALDRHQAVRRMLEPDWNHYRPRVPPPRSYLRNVTRCINELGRGAAAGQLSNRYGFAADRIDRWGTRVRFIASRSGLRGGRPYSRRWGDAERAFFPTNLSPEEWQAAEEAQRALSSILQSPESDSMRRMVLQALRQRAGGHGDLWFYDVKPALQFITFLARLGVSLDRLRFVHYPRNSSDAKGTQISRARWASALGVDVEAILVSPRKTTQLSRSHGALGIQVASPNEEALLKGSKENGPDLPPATEAADDDVPPARTARRFYGSVGFWLGLRLGYVLDTALKDDQY